MSQNLKAIIVVAILLFIVNLFTDYESETEKKNAEYTWRSPKGDEYGKFGRILVANNIRDCGEYHVKETSRSYEFILACTADGKTWNYYVIFTGTEDVFLASYDILSTITPPR